MSEMEVPKKTPAPPFYISSWLSPPPPVSSALFHDRKGRRQGQGAQVLLSPPWPGVPSWQRVLFLCESPLGSGCELRLAPQWPRLTFAQSPMLNIARHYLKAVWIILMIKKQQLICWICACILKDNGDRRKKTMEKSDLKKDKYTMKRKASK